MGGVSFVLPVAAGNAGQSGNDGDRSCRLPRWTGNGPADVWHREKCGGLLCLYANYRSEERRVGKECRSLWSAYH